MKSWTGLFIGAGFSYEAGMPLVWELTAEIKRWLTAEKLAEFNESWRAQGGGQSDVILAEFHAMLQRPDMHYEAVLGYLETQARRQRTNSGEYHYLYSWLVQLVSYLLYWRHIQSRGFLDANLPLYDGVKVLAEQSAPLWVFSLNHDVVMEAIAARLGIKLHSGFSPEIVGLPLRDTRGRVKGKLNAELLTEDTLERHALYFPNPPEPGIYLLKLHGALDIFATNDGKDLLKLLPAHAGQQGPVDSLFAVNEDLYFPEPGSPRGRANIMNEIAYADEQGVMQFLRRSLLAGAHKFDKRHSQTLPMSMMKHFQANLNFVSHLVCIGYGFGDIHINQVIRDWLEFTDSRTLEIVGPDCHSVPAFLLHVAPQVSMNAQSATAWLDGRAGIQRTSRERVEKRLRDMIRKMDKDAGADEPHSAESLRQVQVFLRIAERLEMTSEDAVFGPAGIVAVAQMWSKEKGLTQGVFLERLENLVFKGTRGA